MMAAGLYDITNETLGKGHFAVVKLAKHCLTGELVAVKIIDKSRLMGDSLQKLGLEIKLLSRLSEKAHPNIVKLYQVIDTKSKLYLVMEYAGREVCDLSDYLEKLGQLREFEARYIFKQICSAIDYCHSLRIVHRDLKPENVLIVTGPGDGLPSTCSLKYPIVKLIDFGLSNQWVEGEKLRTSCGSLAYSPPEVLLGDQYSADKVDVWSLGCILYFLFYGYNPFWRKNDNETLTRIMDCKFSTPSRSSMSENSIHLIKSLLRKDPSARLTLKEILVHPWLMTNDEENDESEDNQCYSGTQESAGDFKRHSSSASDPEKKSPSLSRNNSRTLHDRVIDFMLSKDMCESKDQVENALQKKCRKESNADLCNGNNTPNISSGTNNADDESDGRISQDSYLTATYHLLKDKLAREYHQNFSSNSNSINCLTKRVCSNQWKQTQPRFKPSFGSFQRELSTNNSLQMDLSPEEDGGFSLPLARKCSIVSEEGSCADTSFNDSGSERLIEDFTSDMVRSKPSVDIVITDCSFENEDAIDEDYIDPNTAADYENVITSTPAENATATPHAVDSTNGVISANSTELNVLHLVSSSPELLRDEDYRGPEALILDSSKEFNEVINSFNQKSSGDSKSSSFTTTSMRIIVQSKSCNNILMGEGEKECGPGSDGSGNTGAIARAGQRVKNETRKAGRFFFKSKNDKADCCNIC